jgi:hypothetical protein
LVLVPVPVLVLVLVVLTLTLACLRVLTATETEKGRKRRNFNLAPQGEPNLLKRKSSSHNRVIGNATPTKLEHLPLLNLLDLTTVVRIPFIKTTTLWHSPSEFSLGVRLTTLTTSSVGW